MLKLGDLQTNGTRNPKPLVARGACRRVIQIIRIIMGMEKLIRDWLETCPRFPIQTIHQSITSQSKILLAHNSRMINKFILRVKHAGNPIWGVQAWAITGNHPTLPPPLTPNAMARGVHIGYMGAHMGYMAVGVGKGHNNSLVPSYIPEL